MSVFSQIFHFYKEGFQSLSQNGKRLWLIIILKLLILFGIFKIFFFKDYLNSRFQTEQEKIEYITDQLTNTTP